MVVRIHALDKWSKVEAGQLLKLDGDHARRVRIEVNAPSMCRLDAVVNNRLTFLHAWQGIEVIEFNAPAGEVHLAFTGPDELWVSTVDGESIGYESAMQSFTKPMSRAERNPDLERMMWKLEQNARRREAQQRAEFEAILAARMPVKHDPETGEVDDDVSSGAASGATVNAGTASSVAGTKPGTEAGTAKDKTEGAGDGAGA